MGKEMVYSKGQRKFRSFLLSDKLGVGYTGYFAKEILSMKWKRFLAGFLAGALAVTGVPFSKLA